MLAVDISRNEMNGFRFRDLWYPYLLCTPTRIHEVHIFFEEGYTCVCGAVSVFGVLFDQVSKLTAIVLTVELPPKPISPKGRIIFELVGGGSIAFPQYNNPVSFVSYPGQIYLISEVK